MLSFFPRHVLDENLDLIESLRGFLPTLVAFFPSNFLASYLWFSVIWLHHLVNRTLRNKTNAQPVKCRERYKMHFRINGWIDDLQFYVLLNSISVISGRWAGGNERLCAMEPRLRLSRLGLERAFLGTARSVRPALNPLSYRSCSIEDNI